MHPQLALYVPTGYKMCCGIILTWIKYVSGLLSAEITFNSYKANPVALQKQRSSLSFSSFLANGLIAGFRWTSNTATAVDFAVVKNKRPCS